VGHGVDDQQAPAGGGVEVGVAHLQVAGLVVFDLHPQHRLAHRHPDGAQASGVAQGVGDRLAGAEHRVVEQDGVDPLALQQALDEAPGPARVGEVTLDVGPGLDGVAALLIAPGLDGVTVPVDPRGVGGTGEAPATRRPVGPVRRGPPSLSTAMAVTTMPPPLRTRIAGYVALTKPRIIELLLVTTVPTMIVAQRGLPPLWLIAATVAGGTLAAGGANAINMYVDRDIDSVMERTKGRPLVTGVVSPRAALVFAVALEVIAFGFLWATVNLLSAVLAVAACLFYVFVYTLWLKRSSSRNIVIGGAAGAAPVLIGWSAVTNSLDWAPVVLFAVIFYWTPPHFWALAIRYREDYARADVPMLPSVVSVRRTAVRILGYTLLLWALTLAFSPVAGMGHLYLGSALVLGAVFTWYAVRLLRIPEPDPVAGPAGEVALRAGAMRLFTWSITYITLLFGAMAADQLVRSGW
jgi:heme o synthase